MLKYSCNEEFLKVLQLKTKNIYFTDAIINAIKNKELINYNDEIPRYILNDVGIDDFKLVFYFSDGTVKEILYNQFTIKQSKSIPNEFYIENINSSDYFVIIFNCIK